MAYNLGVDRTSLWRGHLLSEHACLGLHELVQAGL